MGSQEFQAAGEDVPVKFPGLDSIGSGYDILGLYASSESVTFPLFDFGAFDKVVTVDLWNRDGGTRQVQYSVPSAVAIDITTLSQAAGTVISGYSLDTYQQELSGSVSVSGLYELFSGSVSSQFDISTFRSDQFAYSTKQFYVKLWRLTLPTAKTLTAVLNPDFKRDLATMDPNTLFATYGGYYLSSIIIGGRLDYSVNTDQSQYQSSYAVKTAVELSYADLIGAKISASEKAAVDALRASSTQTLSAVGGNPASAEKLLAGGGEAALNNWFDSVTTAGGGAFSGYASRDNMRPIWDLCETPERRQALLDAFPAYIADATRNFPPQAPWLRVVSTGNMWQRGTDRGSGANRDLSVFAPVVGDGYKWLGHFAQGNYNSQPQGTALIVQPLSSYAVRPPVGFEAVWTDAGSGKSRDYSLWRPLPPPGYTALGCVMRLGVSNQNPPSGDEIAGLVCVHSSLVIPGRFGDIIWTDKGSGASRDVTVLQAKPVDATTAYAAGTFFAVDTYNVQPNSTPPAGAQVFCLGKVDGIVIGP